ncbi:MAG: hypothetical protein AB8B80_16455 [Marinicellaceae bacterium]
MRIILFIGLTITVSALIGCANLKSTEINSEYNKVASGVAGPWQLCPDDSQLSYFRKSGRELNSYADCFAGNVGQLLKQNKMQAYIRWLTMKGELHLAEEKLLIAVNLSADKDQWFKKLIELNVNQNNWNQALHYLKQSQLDINDHLRLVVEARTGQFSDSIDFNRVPAIFQASSYYSEGSTKQAKVNTVNGSGFELTRVDNAKSGVLAGESSMVASQDGQKVWLLWTDSSGPIEGSTEFNIWKLRSARSIDGGRTWLNDDFSINPENQFTFHFDPMTAYDPINDLMYAGGLTTEFSQTFFSSYYLKRWDLGTGIIEGPFQTEANLDKDWLAANQSGDIFMVDGLTNPNMKVSMNQGESFQDVFHGGGFLFPQPEFDLNDCLHIIDFRDFVRCDGQGSFETVVAPTTSFGLNLDTVLPGNFRAIATRLIGFHPNGDSFIVYPDLKTTESDQVVLWMTRSVDGNVWQAPWIISPDVPGDRFLPWFEIDSAGGLHLSYADTRNHVVPDGDPDAGIDMYYSYSEDLGQTWQETRVTPSTLMIPELTWGDYFFSDYLEMSVGNPGTVFMSFPWFDGTGDMDMYVAKKLTDLIFNNGFEELD